MNIHGTKQIYIITLPDGKKIEIWFIGSVLEKVLNAYNIPYKIRKKERV